MNNMSNRVKVSIGLAIVAVLLFATILVYAQTDPRIGHQVIREPAVLMHDDVRIGTAEYWNTRYNFIVNLQVDDGWMFTDIQIFAGEDPPALKKDRPVPGKFPCKRDLPGNQSMTMVQCSLNDELDLKWGGDQTRYVTIHGDLVKRDLEGNVIALSDFWAYPTDEDGIITDYTPWPLNNWGGYFTTLFVHPRRGHFVDAPVSGLTYETPTNWGVTDSAGAFDFFPGETVNLWVGTVHLGEAVAEQKISPLDIFMADVTDPRVINMARLLQTLDADGVPKDKIEIKPSVIGCLDMAMEILGSPVIDFADDFIVQALIDETLYQCEGNPEANLVEVSAAEAQANLEAGINASGIFRKNISKTEDFAEGKQKLEVMPVYLPAMRSNGDPSYCDMNANGFYDEEDQLGVPYEEWRMNGDPLGEECDPRVDGDACVVTLIECRDVAKPIVVTYTEVIDIYDDQVTTAFWPGRFSTDIFTAVSRDDGTTWKRTNVSRMADLSSFDLETGEPFPGTSGSPYLKVDDNYILVVWESKFCRSGNPRYSITTCDNPDTPEIETPETGCQVVCNGNPDNGTEVCSPDYPYDDPYYITDIWGVRGKQRSVDYNEVDDVADLGIGEIPYSCLWAGRGVVVTQKELDDGTFASLIPEDDPETEEDESDVLALGDIVWYKPERLTSGRRDAFIPAVGSARGAGFAIAWQEDPSGLRPGKGKGPGEGWSGAISNHKTDIWYSYISADDFARVDANFVSSGPGDDPNGQSNFDEKPGLGRPKPQVPFSLPVRVSDNDMVNTDTLKVEQSGICVTPPNGTEQVCFPEIDEYGDFIPLNEEEIAVQFCDHPDADPVTCCDPDNHEGDPNCEDLKGLYGNLNGTKRFAYLAKDIDEYDNFYGTYLLGGDGIPDYQYYLDNGGTLDLCDESNLYSYMDTLPGSNHERWYTFANASGASKLVCVTSDGRLLDGDVSASRPNIQLQPYTRADGSRGAWVLLAYEESKGMGHSLAASEHDNPVDEIIGDQGQEKPVKQDLGKNVIYHSFDITEPDLVSAGHIVNLPALCGGLYPTYCDDPKTPDVIETDENNPTCTCDAAQPIPLYFEYLQDTDSNPDTPDEWVPDETMFLQYRTEIARRARFIVQSYGKMGETRTAGTIIYKQGQEGQGRPADVFIRRIVVPTSINGVKFNPKVDNPFAFENFECTTYLDQTFALPACPNDNVVGYNCNVWGEASGDRLCGGVFADPFAGYQRRDHINLTSADVNLAVDAGPVDDTPDDPTDDRYGTNKVLLWTNNVWNLGDESYGFVGPGGEPCDVLNGEVCPAMYSNARSHRGFIRGDFLVAAYAFSPNWAAGRNGNDRYNFYIRRSFDGGQTWTTTPADLDGAGVYICPEWRADPTSPDPDGSGNLPPQGIDPLCDECAGIDENGNCIPSVNPDTGFTPPFFGPGEFEPARNISQIKNNKETSSDPRVGATPPTYPIDGTVATQPNLCPNNVCVYVEDTYVDNIFFVAWGTGDNQKATGTNDLGGEAAPLDLYYTRSTDYGDSFLKVPWLVKGDNSNQAGETVMRYERLAWGEEEQGECQLKATSDGSKAYAIFHQLTPVEPDPDEPVTRWYPWEVEESHDNDLWFRRLIFWEEDLTDLGLQEHMFYLNLFGFKIHLPILQK